MTSVADLSSGDKLSLKGKIFELQKRLHVIELEEKIKEEQDITYKPIIFTKPYDLPGRDDDFTESVRRAEMIRRQKLDMTKACMTMEVDKQCTFSPEITRRSRKLKQGGQRVGERLYEKGKEYSAKLERSRKFHHECDPDSGRKLFQPDLNKHKSRANKSGDLSADDFLYRESRDREERTKMREYNDSKARQDMAAAPKMNTRSEMLLKKKRDRDIRGIFEYLNVDGAGQIRYDDIQRSYEELAKAKVVKAPDIYSASEVVWTLLDVQRVGFVALTQFVQVAQTAWEHNTQTSEWKLPEDGCGVSTLAHASKAEFLTLKTFFRHMSRLYNIGGGATGSSDRDKETNKKGSAAQRSFGKSRIHIFNNTSNLVDGTPSKPKINKKSDELAKKRIRKDQALLAANRAAVAATANGNGLIPSIPGGDLASETSVLSTQNSSQISDYMLHRLESHSALKEIRVAKLRKETEAMAMRDCTFTPTLEASFSKHTSPVTPLRSRLDSSERIGGPQGLVVASQDEETSATDSSVHERLFAISRVQPPPKFVTQSARELEDAKVP
jgi:hypothetical protein